MSGKERIVPTNATGTPHYLSPLFPWWWTERHTPWFCVPECQDVRESSHILGPLFPHTPETRVGFHSSGVDGSVALHVSHPKVFGGLTRPTSSSRESKIETTNFTDGGFCQTNFFFFLDSLSFRSILRPESYGHSCSFQSQ